MKTSPFFIACLLTLSVAAQKRELNAYGEAKTTIQRASFIQGWTDKILNTHKTTIIQRLGEGMFYEVYNHSNLNQWPEAYSTARTFNTEDPNFEKYTVWFMMNFGDYSLVRVSYKDNTSMPASWQMKDKTDFYFLMFENGIRNVSDCISSATNKPSSYPEAAFARNIKKSDTPVIIPGQEEFDKGLKADDEAEYKEAMDWYKKAAEKGNVAAMYNIGTLYYNNRTGESYSTQSILEQAKNPGEARKKRMIEAMSWFKKAADKDFTKAMYALGQMYRDGEGVTVDKAESKKWFQKAADKGHEKAKAALLGL